jgi:ribosomal protein S18 acetylase RimI-like enzyme
MQVRPGVPADEPELRRILGLTREAAQWIPEGDEVLVVERGAGLAGFLVWRYTAPDEIEILNLAVDPVSRRTGVANALLAAIPRTVVFLEVRESNRAAQSFYLQAGFLAVGLRPGYYENPEEGAIVMRLQS